MSKAAKRERQRTNREERRQAEQQWLKRRRMLRLVRNIAIPIVIVIAVAVAINIVRDGGGSDDADGTTEPAAAPAEGCERDAPPPMELEEGAEYAATVTTSEGTFEIALDAAQAPETVNAFVHQARNGCYDGLNFHRVVEDFVIQGGDPAGDGTGGFGYTLPDEPPAEGYAVGTVAMANSGRGTSGSQFFVVLTDEAAETLHANGQAQAANDGGSDLLYSLLGQVTEGMEVAQAIGVLDPSETTIVIESVTVTEDGAPLGPTDGDDSGDEGGSESGDEGGDEPATDPDDEG